MLPELDMNEKYRSVHTTDRGTIFVQNGYAFTENKRVVGLAPNWGPDLFLGPDGKPIDAFDKILSFAKANPVKENIAERLSTELIDEVFDGPTALSVEQVEAGRRGTKPKVTNAPRHGSRPL